MLVEGRDLFRRPPHAGLVETRKDGLDHLLAQNQRPGQNTDTLRRNTVTTGTLHALDQRFGKSYQLQLWVPKIHAAFGT